MLSVALSPLEEQSFKSLKDGTDEYGLQLALSTEDTTIVESDSASDDAENRTLPLSVAPPKALKNRIRHVDSLASYVKHCEQQHQQFFSTTLGSNVEDENELSRKVRFVQPDEKLFVVHSIPAVDDQDRGSVWLMASDFERQEKEVQMTLWRWENHLAGDIPFDQETSSVRGLEHLIKDMKAPDSQPNVKHRASKAGKNSQKVAAVAPLDQKLVQPSSKRRHRQAIKAEIARQKQASNENFVLDHEQLRRVAEEASREDLEKVIRQGKEDAQAAIDAWKVSTAQAAQSTNKTKKKGKGFKFWKRS